MRSSKSRSRSKSNRSNNNNNNRSSANVVNRVFDSSGPEGKVRGTPQQIIEKYNQLARDAQLSNDRVATENFQQHAEHYLRLLGVAMKEQEAKREQHERENRDRQQERDRDRAQRQEREAAAPAPQDQQQQDQQQQQPSNDPASAPQPDVVEASADNGLVETPESKPKLKSRSRPRKPKVEQPAEPAPDTASDAAE